jgi:predicted transcriptional regulator of viral defense system
MRNSEISKVLRLCGLRVFRIADLERLTGKGRDYLYLFVSKSKEIKRVQNGVYYLAGTERAEIASSICRPSYISLAYALMYHGGIDQVIRTIKVVTDKRHRRIQNADGIMIEFKTVKKNLLYGYRRIGGVVVAEPEKAIIDALYLGEDLKYAKEALANLDGEGRIDMEKLKLYAKRTGKRSVVDRLAYMMKSVAQ